MTAEGNNPDRALQTMQKASARLSASHKDRDETTKDALTSNICG